MKEIKNKQQILKELIAQGLNRNDLMLKAKRIRKIKITTFDVNRSVRYHIRRAKTTIGKIKRSAIMGNTLDHTIRLLGIKRVTKEMKNAFLTFKLVSNTDEA